MGDINLFRINGQVEQLSTSAYPLERELQVLVERNMATFFGVTFLDSEFPIQNGRIDSLGIDENYCPVIFEYKRSQNENVINQGLFYLDWLMDHRADFKLLVIDKLGMSVADRIDWSVPCVICIASDFTKFDEHAVNQMQKNIKLIKYKRFGEDMLLFEQINTPQVKQNNTNHAVTPANKQDRAKGLSEKNFDEQLKDTSPALRELYYAVRDYILSLGDDVAENKLQLYSAFKKIKNVVCVVVRKKDILLFLRINPDTVQAEQAAGLVRDVRTIGHWGTGDVEATIRSADDFEKIKHLVERSYAEN